MAEQFGEFIHVVGKPSPSRATIRIDKNPARRNLLHFQPAMPKSSLGSLMPPNGSVVAGRCRMTETGPSSLDDLIRPCNHGFGYGKPE